MSFDLLPGENLLQESLLLIQVENANGYTYWRVKYPSIVAKAKKANKSGKPRKPKKIGKRVNGKIVRLKPEPTVAPEPLCEIFAAAAAEAIA